jgi:hypothetical protein
MNLRRIVFSIAFLALVAFVFSNFVYALTWNQVNVDDFGVSGTGLVNSMAVWDGNLYAATDPSVGTEIWEYSGSGTDWTQVNEDGFGDPANGNAVLVVFNDHLYAGVTNGDAGAEVWEYNGSGTDLITGWTLVNTPGFGDLTFQGAISSMAVWDGHLYAGTNGLHSRVWEYSGSGTDWTAVSEEGFGDVSGNQGVPAMIAFGFCSRTTRRRARRR